MTLLQITSRMRMHQRSGFRIPFEMDLQLLKEVSRLEEEQGVDQDEAIRIVSELEKKAIHKRWTFQYLEDLLEDKESSDLNYSNVKKPVAL